MPLQTNKTYSCGCSFNLDENGNVELDLNIDNIPLDCDATWDLLATGRTKCIFQLESNLGKTNTKKLSAENIEQLAALGAILRPGSLKCFDEEGVSTTDHYIKRKNKQEDVVIKYKELDDILRPTEGVLIYQEQSIQIAMRVGGFNEVDADVLRKAIGKKDTEEMARVRDLFLSKGKEANVLPEEALLDLFDQIRQSQRYAFNKCVAGTTTIKRMFGNKHNCNVNIEEMYRIRNDINFAKRTGHLSLYKKWKLRGNFGKGLSFIDGRFKPNIIQDISFAGIRDVYRITTADGRYIDATDNHKFPTSNGIKQLKDITTNDMLYVCGTYEQCNKKYGWSSYTIPEIRDRGKLLDHDGRSGFMGNESNPGYTNGEYSKFLANSAKLPNKCQKCEKVDCRIETHHRDGNRQNNELNNLINLCVSCHKKEEYKLGRTKVGQKGYPSYLVGIESITYVGEQNTYDVEMDGPYHDFVANDGILTCNSHAVCYGIIGYLSAYIKAHFPKVYYCACLIDSENKGKKFQEVHELVQEAKLAGYTIRVNDLRMLNKTFDIKGDDIYFGLSNIRGVGSGSEEIVEIGKTIDFDSTTWMELLVKFTPVSGYFQKMIEAGSLDFVGKYRKVMVFELGLLAKFTKKQFEWVKDNYHQYNTISELLEAAAKTKKEGGAAANITGVRSIQNLLKIARNPPQYLVDDAEYIAENEEFLLGTPITCSKVDDKNFSANCSCAEFETFNGKDVLIAAEIQALRQIKVKSGKSCGRYMAFLTIGDNSGSLDSVTVFSDQLEKYKNLLFVSNTVIVKGIKDKKRNCFIANEIHQI